jgi:hypothetical protein
LTSGEPTLIDRYLPRYDFNETHEVELPLAVPDAYPRVRGLDFSSSLVIRTLFLLRGIGTRNMSLDTILNGGIFRLLAENEGQEFVIGAVLTSWLLPEKFKDADEFLALKDESRIKIAWNFTVQELDSGSTRVTTETRILCLGDGARRIFSAYWSVIRPFSGLVRIEMLRILKKDADRSGGERDS